MRVVLVQGGFERHACFWSFCFLPKKVSSSVVNFCPFVTKNSIKNRLRAPYPLKTPLSTLLSRVEKQCHRAPPPRGWQLGMAGDKESYQGIWHLGRHPATSNRAAERSAKLTWEESQARRHRHVSHYGEPGSSPSIILVMAYIVMAGREPGSSPISGSLCGRRIPPGQCLADARSAVHASPQPRGHGEAIDGRM